MNLTRRPAAASCDELGLQFVDDEPVGVDADTHHVEAMVAEDVEREEVRRFLDDDDIARLGQHGAQQLEGL